jgi:hypothetical protein
MKQDNIGLKHVVQGIMLAKKENVASRKSAELVQAQLVKLITDGTLPYLTEDHVAAFFAELPENPNAVLVLPSVAKLWEWFQYTSDFSGEGIHLVKGAPETVRIARSVDLETLQYDQVRYDALQYSQALRVGNDAIIEQATYALSLHYPKSRIKYMHWICP